MIPRAHISEGLKKFIREEIQTVFRLELLLFIHRNQQKSFSVKEVADELGLENDVVEEQLTALVGIGILTACVEQANYRYEPANMTIRTMVDQLAHAYPTQRVLLLSLILSEETDKVRVFAEAIKLLRQSH